MRPLLALLLMPIVFSLVACAGGGKRPKLTLIPQSTINSMGAEAFEDIKKKTPQENKTAIKAHIQCITQRILQHTQDETGVKDWETVVFQDKMINAFALPSGKIGVYTGLMGVAENADQLAAVIGHEVGHVIAEHGNERMSQGLLVQGGLAAVNHALDDEKKEQNVVILGALGLGLQYGVLMPHSRSHESEADLIGLELMAKAGFDPRESAKLWQNMGKAGGKQGPEFLSTHPSHSTRIKDLNANMKNALQIYEKTVQAGGKQNCGPNPLAPS